MDREVLKRREYLKVSYVQLMENHNILMCRYYMIRYMMFMICMSYHDIDLEEGLVLMDAMQGIRHSK